MYKIETEIIYEVFYKNKELFDFSNYLEESNFYDNSNSSVVGKMKDETCDMPIRCVVGLKAKMYTLIT